MLGFAVPMGEYTGFPEVFPKFSTLNVDIGE